MCIRDSIQAVIISRIQGDTPPEIQLLTQLLGAPGKADRERVMAEAAEMISPELIEMVDLVREQAVGAGQGDLAERLVEIRAELNARLLVAGGD